MHSSNQNERTDPMLVLRVIEVILALEEDELEKVEEVVPPREKILWE